MISPIQTSYSGYKFRSRLEARWAVFFTALGLQWVYEPEGFVLPNGVYYLPDFQVTSPTGLKQWYEIKPEGVTTDPKFEAFNAALLTMRAQKQTLPVMHAQLLSGDPLHWVTPHLNGTWAKPAAGGVCPRCGALHTRFSYGPLIDFDSEVAVGCWSCDYDTPDGGGHPVEKGILGPCWPHKGTVMMSKPHWLLALTRLRAAATRARGARFEHGESPDA